MMNANLPRSGGLQLFGSCVGEKTMRIGDLLRKFPKIRRGRLFGKKTASLLYFCRKFDKNNFYNNHNYKNSSATFPSTEIHDFFLVDKNLSKSEMANFDKNHSAKKPWHVASVHKNFFTLLRTSTASLHDSYSGEEVLSLLKIASTRSGSRVILCMGSIRKECIAKDWQIGLDSSWRITSTKRGFSRLQKKEILFEQILWLENTRKNTCD